MDRKRLRHIFVLFFVDFSEELVLIEKPRGVNIFNFIQSKLIANTIEKITTKIVRYTISYMGIELKNKDIEHIQNLLLVFLFISDRDLIISIRLEKKLCSHLNPSKMKASEFAYERKINDLTIELRKKIEFEKNNPTHYKEGKGPWKIVTNYIVEYIAKIADIKMSKLTDRLPGSSWNEPDSYEDFIEEQINDLRYKLWNNPLVRIFDET